MYYYINGKIALLTPDTAVLDCGGVGYKLAISENTYKAVSGKSECKLLTYLNVKEDALDLYGFADEQEKLFFTLLLSISGVGPKVALSVLSELTPEEFAACIVTQDVARLKKANGVGAKVAQRICLELKDKMGKISVTGSDLKEAETETVAEDAVSEAIAVLVALGYTKPDALAAVKKCSADNTNDLVRQALRILSRKLLG